MYELKKKKGYSLVEVLVATSILLIATLGPMTIAHRGLQAARFGVEQSMATFLAQEGIEAVVAARNNSIIAAIAADDLSQSWDWTENSTNPGISNCFAGTGCNMGFANQSAVNNFVNCASIANCTMYYHDGWNIPYREVQDATVGEDTQFMRVITLNEVTADQEVRITSTVYWDSNLTGGTDREEVVLHSAVFNLYE